MPPNDPGIEDVPVPDSFVGPYCGLTTGDDGEFPSTTPVPNNFLFLKSGILNSPEIFDP